MGTEVEGVGRNVSWDASREIETKIDLEGASRELRVNWDSRGRLGMIWATRTRGLDDDWSRNERNWAGTTSEWGESIPLGKI